MEDADADEDNAGCGSSPAAWANGDVATSSEMIALVRIALAFGAKGAKGDPMPQMFNLGFTIFSND